MDSLKPFIFNASKPAYIKNSGTANVFSGTKLLCIENNHVRRTKSNIEVVQWEATKCKKQKKRKNLWKIWATV